MAVAFCRAIFATFTGSRFDFGGEGRKHEVAVTCAAGAFAGQRIIRQYFEANGRDVCGQVFEGERVRIGRWIFSADENRCIVFGGERRALFGDGGLGFQMGPRNLLLFPLGLRGDEFGRGRFKDFAHFADS